MGALDQAAGRFAVSQRTGGSEQPGATGARRSHRAERIHARRRAAASAAQCALDKFGAGYLELRASPEPFRRDLVAHLNVITLRVPPLRDYSEDVPDLLRYYVDRLVDEQHLPLRRFSVAAQNRLRNYPWPGNVGELKNLVQRVLILGVGEEIRLEEIERELAVKLAVDEPLVKQDLLALPLREARRAVRAGVSSAAAASVQRQGGSIGQAVWAWSARTYTENCGH